MNIQTSLHPDGISRRSGVLIASALLVASGVWSCMAARSEHSVLFGLLGLAAFAGAFGLLDSRRWARYAIHAFTVALVAEFSYGLYLSSTYGDFEGLSVGRLALVIAPSLLVMGLAIVSAFSVHRYFNPPAAKATALPAMRSFSSQPTA